MKITQLVLISGLLEQLSKIEAKQPTGVLPFPGGARGKLVNIFCEVAAAHDRYVKARNALVKQFGEEQPDKSHKVTDEAKLELYTKEHAKLLESETKLKIEPIKVADLTAANVPVALICALIEQGVAKK